MTPVGVGDKNAKNRSFLGENISDYKVKCQTFGLK